VGLQLLNLRFTLLLLRLRLKFFFPGLLLVFAWKFGPSPNSEGKGIFTISLPISFSTF
jgi:hypothetical protein